MDSGYTYRFFSDKNWESNIFVYFCSFKNSISGFYWLCEYDLLSERKWPTLSLFFFSLSSPPNPFLLRFLFFCSSSILLAAYEMETMTVQYTPPKTATILSFVTTITTTRHQQFLNIFPPVPFYRLYPF